MTEVVSREQYYAAIGPLKQGARFRQICDAFPGVNETTISKRLVKMVNACELWKIGPHLRTRWFADKQAYDEFAKIADQVFAGERAESARIAKEKKAEWRRANVKEINAKSYARKAAKKALLPQKPKPVKKCKPANVQVTKVVKRLTGGEVVIPAGVKVQKLPGFKGDRFAVTGPIVGGFRSMGIGRYIWNKT